MQSQSRQRASSSVPIGKVIELEVDGQTADVFARDAVRVERLKEQRRVRSAVPDIHPRCGRAPPILF